MVLLPSLRFVYVITPEVQPTRRRASPPPNARAARRRVSFLVSRFSFPFVPARFQIFSERLPARRSSCASRGDDPFDPRLARLGATRRHFFWRRGKPARTSRRRGFQSRRRTRRATFWKRSAFRFFLVKKLARRRAPRRTSRRAPRVSPPRRPLRTRRIGARARPRARGPPRIREGSGRKRKRRRRRRRRPRNARAGGARVKRARVKRREGGRTERTPTPRFFELEVRPSPTRSPAARPRASPRGASSREASPRGASHPGRPRRDIARTRTSRRPRRRPSSRRARVPGLLPEEQRSRSYWTKAQPRPRRRVEPRRRRGSVPTSSRPASLPVGPPRQRRTTRRAPGAPGARGGTS